MFFKKLFGLFFIGLLIFGLLGFFGRSSGSGYDSAYRQGFIDGQQADVASDVFYLKHLFLPNIQRIGGLRAASSVASFQSCGASHRHGRSMWPTCSFSYSETAARARS